MINKLKFFRVEYFEQGVYEAKNITTIRKKIRRKYGEDIRTFSHQKYFEIKEIKKDKKGMLNFSYTKAIER